jgi:hypothetical protein
MTRLGKELIASLKEVHDHVTTGRKPEDQFDRDHQPGTLTPTASVLPCLFVPAELLPAWCPTPYSYALHLTGEAPFPELDTKILRRGRYLEPCGRMALQEEFGLRVYRPNGEGNGHLRRFADKIPALCYLDDTLENDPATAVEYKSLNERDFLEHWQDGPPDYPRAQANVQMTIDPKLERVIIVAIIMKYGTIDVAQFEEPRDPATCDMIADETHAFVQLLRRGGLPEYDGSERSYEAWARKVEPDPEVLLDLSADPDARWRAEAWYQATLDKKDVESTIEAHHRWFASRLEKHGWTPPGRIRVSTVPEDIRLKTVERKGYSVDATRYLDVRWMKREKG